MPKRKHLKKSLKAELIAEAGGKCANPGCSNWRVHFHHIEHWSAYQTDDANIMIAVCPSCHDHIHNGKLPISDETLYQWKNIERPLDVISTHIWVEPDTKLRMILGSIAFETVEGAIVFDLPGSDKFEMHIFDKKNLQISSTYTDRIGKERLRVSRNNIEVHNDAAIEVDQRPGRFRVVVPATDLYIDANVIRQMRLDDNRYGAKGKVTALDIEVIKPGTVRVEGIWASDEGTFVVHRGGLFVCRPGPTGLLCIKGKGERSVIKHSGPVSSIFALNQALR
ncbi:HNH endonuclease signature motif containing protein [Lichenifustis flavocetrariae]|uniref:HNH endonuclease n=1 Tax=Lichenifustis flavocetrariae TaxID=2949735 RepID=A0AA41Z2H6_9HYPH|nr:HNH endonuclease signature motif containing protein [Lichenifustis flavocetrariae]MCW6512519.1 HNH endonuclease [Lichenifustis flavocetrariae]